MRALLTLLTLLLALGPVRADDDGGPYAKLDGLLRKHVDQSGMVDYKGLKQQEQALRGVVADLARADASKLEGAAKKAYWINVYNALTLQAIVERYPLLRSIKDLNTKKYDVWKDYRFGPKKLSLNDIEHQILRPMGDPRIHSAIVCASKGCPPLRNEAYQPGRLDAQLDANVRTWLKSPTRGLRLEGDTLYLSSIFEWFGKDFGDGTTAAHLKWIARFVDDGGLEAKLLSGKLRVKSMDWDWSLNAQ
ncbi:MAG: DUF547 domain-containing protein [Planctomycetota bacterium]